MSIKVYKSGSWQDVSSVKAFKNGSWQNISSGKIYKNGSWQEVYPNLPKLNNSDDAFYLFKNKIVNTYSGISVSLGGECTILDDCVVLPSSTSYIGSGIQISLTAGYVWRHKHIFVYTKNKGYGTGSIKYGNNDGGTSSPQTVQTKGGYYNMIYGVNNITQGYIPIISGGRNDKAEVYAIIGTNSTSAPWDGITGL